MSNPYVTPQFRCAGPNCEAVRKASNHWFVIWPGAGGVFHCAPLSLFQYPDELLSDMKPVCGQACAQKIFEQYLANAASVNPTAKGGQPAISNI